MDMHVHLRPLPPRSADAGPQTTDEPGERIERMKPLLKGFLYCGVTSVFDAGNDGDYIYSLRSRERAGELSAPRIFCAGPFVTCPDGHGSHLAGITAVQSLPADLDRLLDHFANRPDLIKITYDEHGWHIRPIIPKLDPATLSGIISAAHDNALRVTVHVSHETRAREAVAAGADTLAHPVIQSPVTDEFVALLADRQIPVVSTLSIGEQAVRLADTPGFVDEPIYVATLPASERDYLRTAEHATQRQSRRADWMRVMTPVAQENLRKLIAAGGVVVTGTDLSLGAAMHREMRLLQQAGVPAWDVLRSATVNGAAFLGRETTMGVVQPGMVGDLIVVDDDPTADVANLQTISLVMKAGELVDREQEPARDFAA
jgi:imidazolonepropionase-like amidohydrolase